MDAPKGLTFLSRHRPLSLMLSAWLVAACATLPEASDKDAPPPAVHGSLAYFQQLQRMSPQAVARERISLSAAAQTPTTQVRLAMLLGQTHAANDLGKAVAMLNALLKSNAPEAVELQPLIQLLATQYQERVKSEAQNEKSAQQLKESQRRGDELQEKLNAIADIENSLSSRPSVSRPAHRAP